MATELEQNAEESSNKHECNHDSCFGIGVLFVLIALIGGGFIGRESFVPDGNRPVAIAKSLTVWTVAVCVFDASPVKINDRVGISASDASRCTSLGSNDS